VSGKVIDEKTGEALPYVNIGIRLKNKGTTSGIDGTFSITVEPKFKNDSLVFSMIGYEELKLPLLFPDAFAVYKLKEKAYHLSTVTISARKPVIKKFGIHKYNPHLHFIDASTNQQDIFEIAQLIKPGKTPVKITSLNLHLNESRADSGVFRINFYQWNKEAPGKRIVEKNITQTKAIKEGWLKFDLRDYNIVLTGPFVAGIEFLPSGKKTRSIEYEVKLGGRSRSFVRTSSLGEWGMPPHHYRMYVEALTDVAEDKTEEEDEEKEATPAAIIFSNHVKDSFNVFIGLPQSYSLNINKNYPVVYLTDANAFFDEIYHRVLLKKKEIILVGIGYRDAFKAEMIRERDLTYPVADKQDSLPLSGGANNFMGFIKDELIPFVDNSYRTKTAQRTLFGHSLGGYFTLFSLIKEDPGERCFNNYISGSPSLEYASGYLLRCLKQKRNDPALKGLVFITAGKDEGEKELDRAVSELKKCFEGMEIRKEFYPAAGHMETALPSFEKGLDLINFE
jgi:hypothetical protein